jgi:hypothetical protein
MIDGFEALGSRYVCVARNGDGMVVVLTLIGSFVRKDKKGQWEPTVEWEGSDAKAILRAFSQNATVRRNHTVRTELERAAETKLYLVYFTSLQSVCRIPTGFAIVFWVHHYWVRHCFSLRSHVEKPTGLPCLAS